MSEPTDRKQGERYANFSFDTQVVHAGWDAHAEPTGAVMPPIYMTSTYIQDGPAKPRMGYEYTRTQNPTRFALQDALAALENGKAAFTCASGMAAVHTLMLTLKPGDLIVAGRDLYGGSHRLFDEIQARFGLRYLYVDTTQADVLDNLPEDTTLLYLETPSNPTLCVTDLEAAIAGAKKVGARTAVDNTFATPALQRPLDLGADYVLHSTTKYICGHSDVVGGALIVKDEKLADDIWFHQNSAGTSNSPFDAFLTLRGLRTLHLRMERHCTTALQIAEWLDQHEGVGKVLYPGLPNHLNHDSAKRQMKAFGGMVSFVLPGGVPQSTRFVEACKLFSLAESLGGVESLIELPAPMTHASLSPEKRKEIGIEDGLVRLSVGIEDSNDLLADLDQALAESVS
ncbi:MAG: PLP-dependent aspartate aminotransferase family protein [Planctomycetota bacterium]|nr:PLP-dependent aspartate aminotransferase family protein [Planctomycetota bacterium]MDP7559430.1 PLP-dependent aspartate aminotransferase family protein [Planctomycetota bacterium]